MPRLFIFAGPNGSGKSTVVNAISGYVHNGERINLGIYINADDIASQLKKDEFSFKSYKLIFRKSEFDEFVTQSGLLSQQFTLISFWEKCSVAGHQLIVSGKEFCEKIAQIIARYLRAKCLQMNWTFAFETVFSHKSNTEFIMEAVQAGYEVCLYFVTTASPLINLYRVQVRVQQNGHDVPPERVTERYYRSLDLMYDAAMLCRHTYFFDNSNTDTPFNLVAHIEMIGRERKWHIKNDLATFPAWFIKYYIHKIQAG